MHLLKILPIVLCVKSEYYEWDYLFNISDTKSITWHMVPSTLYDRTLGTVQKVPYPAPLCPQILSGALLKYAITSYKPLKASLQQIYLIIKWTLDNLPATAWDFDD